MNTFYVLSDFGVCDKHPDPLYTLHNSFYSKTEHGMADRHFSYAVILYQFILWRKEIPGIEFVVFDGFYDFVRQLDLARFVIDFD